jgi:hypothetical protein
MGRSIAEGAQCLQQRGQEDVNPLMALLWPMPNGRPYTIWFRMPGMRPMSGPCAFACCPACGD